MGETMKKNKMVLILCLFGVIQLQAAEGASQVELDMLEEQEAMGFYDYDSDSDDEGGLTLENVKESLQKRVPVQSQQQENTSFAKKPLFNRSNVLFTPFAHNAWKPSFSMKEDIEEETVQKQTRQEDINAFKMAELRRQIAEEKSRLFYRGPRKQREHSKPTKLLSRKSFSFLKINEHCLEDGKQEIPSITIENYDDLSGHISR